MHAQPHRPPAPHEGRAEPAASGNQERDEGAPVRERTLEVARTARYVVCGTPGPAVRHVWLCCHGYGQLARDFAAALAPLAADGTALVVAPEALSRFYVERGEPRPHPELPVGASWMTREDRANEIRDYVRWLDEALADALSEAGSDHVTVHALGFSQGAATASRWARLGATPVDELVLWGGLLPPDVEAALDRDPGALRARRTSFVVGTRDALVAPDALERQHARLARRQDGAHRLLRFEGGHRLDAETLRRIARGE